MCVTRGGRVVSDILEVQLEKPFVQLLETRLARDLLQPIRTADWVVNNTARGGPASGKWAHPDIVLTSVRRYRSRAAPELELFGFELKTARGFETSAVHQALAHLRYVHYSHVVVYCPDDDFWEHRLSDVRFHAQTHGVGVIRLLAPSEEADYEISIHARRSEPLPSAVDCFLEDRLPDRLSWVDQRLGRE